MPDWVRGLTQQGRSTEKQQSTEMPARGRAAQAAGLPPEARARLEQRAALRRSAGRASASAAPDADEQAMAEFVDPEWQPREPLRPSERYLRVRMSDNQFRDAMLNDSAAWGQGADRSVCRAITCAVVECVMPKLADIEGWITHATEFFLRLCSHRRNRGATIDAAIAQLQQRLDSCESAIAELRVSATAAEQLAAAEGLRNSRRAAEAISELRMGRSQSPRGRGRAAQASGLAIDTRIMLAQVAAAQARSASPALSTHAAINELLTRRATGEAPVPTGPPHAAPPDTGRTGSIQLFNQ